MSGCESQTPGANSVSFVLPFQSVGNSLYMLEKGSLIKLYPQPKLYFSNFRMN